MQGADPRRDGGRGAAAWPWPQLQCRDQALSGARSCDRRTGDARTCSGCGPGGTRKSLLISSFAYDSLEGGPPDGAGVPARRPGRGPAGQPGKTLCEGRRGNRPQPLAQDPDARTGPGPIKRAGYPDRRTYTVNEPATGPRAVRLGRRRGLLRRAGPAAEGSAARRATCLKQTSAAESGRIKLGALVQLGADARRSEVRPPDPPPGLGEGDFGWGEKPSYKVLYCARDTAIGPEGELTLKALNSDSDVGARGAAAGRGRQGHLGLQRRKLGRLGAGRGGRNLLRRQRRFL